MSATIWYIIACIWGVCGIVNSNFDCVIVFLLCVIIGRLFEIEGK